MNYIQRSLIFSAQIYNRFIAQIINKILMIPKNSPSQSQIAQAKDKQYEINVPEQIGKIKGAVYSQFGDSQCLTVYTNKSLYFIEIVNQKVSKFSRYNLSNIVTLISIIKGYLLIATRQNKLWLFQLKIIQNKVPVSNPNQNEHNLSSSGQESESNKKEQKVLSVQSFLKEISFNTYFLREVTPNMIELFISFNNENNNKLLYVYQFTIKQKIGGMGFTVDKNFKILRQSRKQLYASKNFYDHQAKSIIKLKNFSDKIFFCKKINQQYLYIIPICKTEDFVGITKHGDIVNIENPQQKLNVAAQFGDFDLRNGITYLNYLLLRNNLTDQCALFSIEESFKVRMLSVLSSQYIWNICFNGKLVGIKIDNKIIKVTKELNKKILRITPLEQIKIENTVMSPTKQKQQAQKQSDPEVNKQKIEQPPSKNQQKQILKQKIEGPEQPKTKSAFKPMRILGKKDLKYKQAENGQQKKQQKPKEVQPKIQPSQQKDDQGIQNKLDQGQIKKQQQKKNEQPKLENLNPALPTNQTIQQASNQKLKQQNSPEESSQRNIVPLENSNSIKEQQKIEKSSPFTKKKTSNEPEVIIPKLSYQEIFGKSPVQQLRSNGNTIFKPESQSQSIKPSPFKKKEQSLEIQNNSSVVKKDKGQIESEIGQKKLRKQRKQKKSKKVLQNIKINKAIQKSLEIKQQNIRRDKEQTKKYYQNFSQKIQQLKSKTQQSKSKFQQISASTAQSIRSTLQKQRTRMVSQSYQNIQREVTNKITNSLNDYLSRRLTPKVNDYFKSVMNQTKKIYDNTLKFYSDRKKQSIISLHNHFQQQEHLVSQVRLITADMMACIGNTVQEGEELYGTLLRQWQKSANAIDSKLNANSQCIENHTHDRSASQRQKILDSLAELREQINTDLQNKKKAQQQTTKAKKQKKPKQKQIAEKAQQKKTSKNTKKQRQKQGIQKQKKKSKIRQNEKVYYYPTPYNQIYPYGFSQV